MIATRTASPLESDASHTSCDSVTVSEASTMSTEAAMNLDELDVDVLLSAAKQALTEKKKNGSNPSNKSQLGQHSETISFDEDDEEDDAESEEKGEDPTLREIKTTLSRIPKLSDAESTFKSVKPTEDFSNGNSNSDSLVFRNISDPVKVKRANKEKKENSAGDKWFNMPKAELTPELKRDLQLIQMRGVLDPKRHYKKNTFGTKSDGTVNFPKFVQKGTIVSDSSEFFSARLTKKERKKTFAEEILSDDKTKNYFKRKYSEIMEEKNKVRSNRRRKY